MRSPKLLCNGVLFFLAAIIASAGSPEKPLPPLPNDANQFVRDTIQNELKSQDNDHTHWRYHLHKEEERGNQDRDVIETKDGSLARTLLINGQPLTPEQRSQDDERMKKLVNDPDERAKRAKRAKQDEEKARQLLQAIPDAFIFKYDGVEGNQVRLDFKPNSNFSPPTRELMVYHAMAGKLWIDRPAMRFARIEGQLFDSVNFGWGLLGHLDKGGTFKVFQKEVGNGHWETVQLDINMQGRAVIFKTITVKQRQFLSDFHRVPDDLTFSQAFEMLQKTEKSMASSTQAAK